MYDFNAGLGQYIVYRNLIQLTEPEYVLYLAIDESIYNGFFQRKSIQAIVTQNQLLLTILDTELEEIRQWID